jgi:kinesin family protein 2/24
MNLPINKNLPRQNTNIIPAKNQPKKSVIDDMEKLKQRREDRMKKNEEDKKAKKENENKQDGGKVCDQDFENLIKKKINSIVSKPEKHISSDNSKIFVCVRKRPIFKKEVVNGEIDCVSASNPKLFVHECKYKIDGITKYIEDYEFYFDNVFHEGESTEDVYKYSVAPTVDMIMNRGIVTCFAYGQTGSGKTHTMKGIQNQAIESLYRAAMSSGKKFDFYISFFEIYGGRLYDLLNGKAKLSVLEDKNQKVQIFGLEHKKAQNPDEMRSFIDLGNSIRTTHNTVTNEVSSRSHSICNIILKECNSDDEYGKLTLVDLAGSERAQETQSNDRQRRSEGAEINKSLLALKECIRALDVRKTNSEVHVPFRASKLTLVLRDSFIPKADKSKIVMIACVSPGYSSANHTINTLRYSDRLKEKTSSMINQIKKENLNNNNNNNKLNVKQNMNMNKESKEIADVNINTFDLRDDDMLDYNKFFDEKLLNEDKIGMVPAKQQKQQMNNEWEYLKKTVQAKDGKYLSDDFIKYHQITEKIVEDEDEIVNIHMNIIKDDAKMLTEEGELITNVRGVGEVQYEMEVYAKRLDSIITQKINLYQGLKKKIDSYKRHIKEEDEIRRKINPNNFES